jgi:BirA family biotin operon repressor/biotin-[acetyl-CoA-carboxylase] ligase
LLSRTELERALAAAGLHAPVRFDEVTGSTNSTALELAEEGSPEWTLVAAGHQTQGRGRLGRTWVDQPGAALMFSFVLRPSRLDPQYAGLIALLTGWAMATAIGEVAEVEVRCKWPNDLLQGDAKVGGILVESAVSGARIRHTVVGLGVNLVPPDELLEAAGIGPFEEADLLAAFLARFREGYERLPEGVVERWSGVAATLGRAVEVHRLFGEPIVGTAVRVDDRGALIVQTQDDRVAVTSGEVQHLREA